MRINFKNMPCESKQALKTDSPDRNGPRAISVRGADAAVFLQGQITADLEKLLPGFCTYAAICSPKGRVITTLEVLRLDHEFILILPPHMDEAVVTHLQKYILRADVQIETKSNKTGVCAWTHPHPDLPIGQCRQLDEQVTWRPRWAHYSDHNWVFGYGGKSGASESATPISWQQARILWGVTQTTPPTRENFLPQMLNMDALDGVSFDKGCYTGQEIIARTHFRGKVKRRMARFLVTKPLTINAGDELLTSADSVAGNVVDWANDDAGNTGILAVIKLAHNDEALMLHDESASPWPLPYSVD